MKVRLGNKASIFYDTSTGTKILKGQIVEASEKASNSVKFKNALMSGFLIKVKEEESAGNTIDSLKETFIELVKKGTKPETIVKEFKLDELKAIAEAQDLEVEQDDTKASLVKAIMEEITSQE